MEVGKLRASRVLEEAVERGVIPGAVALVRRHGKTVLDEAIGHAALEPDLRPMSRATVFDLASLTKPLVGGSVTLALADRGVISLDEEITGLLPELGTFEGKGVTYRRLLTHTAGIAGWRPLYTKGQGRAEILAAVDEIPLAAAPGTRFEYSDIGFIVVGLALERAAGLPLDELAHELIFDPLELEGTGYHPSLPAEAYAVTERGNAFERRMADWAGLSFSRWRTDFHPGEVNDGNAFYGLAGVSAHAGLFSNAYDLGAIGEMWLGHGQRDGVRVLSSAAVDRAIVDQTSTGQKRGLGWALTSGEGPTLDELERADAGFFPPPASPWQPWPSGELMSTGSYGHTGFTGTSLWIDPALELVVVLLTNATHPEVDMSKAVNSTRARFHNAVVAAMTSSDPPT